VAVLSLLAHPGSYRAWEWDLSADTATRAYWLGLFRDHIHTMTDLMRFEPGAAADGRVDAFLHDYLSGLRVLDSQPDAWGTLTIFSLARYRQQVLRRHGFPDPFAFVKARETHAAIDLYPGVVAALDALDSPARMESLARGIFAGNEFDLGCVATTAQYHESGHDFADAIRRVPPRPWPEDDFDAWCERVLSRRPPYRHVLFFVDNAGADVVLGCIPLARELAMSGSRVTLAANSEPSLNDVTVDELNAALVSIGRVDERVRLALAEGRMRTVASGCTTPVIDLADVTDACNEASYDADLLVLEGMGRAVETNRSARFTCDVLRAALIKDPFVAEQIGVKLFEPVWRFDPA